MGGIGAYDSYSSYRSYRVGVAADPKRETSGSGWKIADGHDAELEQPEVGPFSDKLTHARFRYVGRADVHGEPFCAGWIPRRLDHECIRWSGEGRPVELNVALICLARHGQRGLEQDEVELGGHRRQFPYAPDAECTEQFSGNRIGNPDFFLRGRDHHVIQGQWLRSWRRHRTGGDCQVENQNALLGTGQRQCIAGKWATRCGQLKVRRG